MMLHNKSSFSGKCQFYLIWIEILHALLLRDPLVGLTLTLRIQFCVCAQCGVQTGSEPGCLQTRKPCQKTRGGNRLKCHLGPKRQRKCVVKQTSPI